MAKTIPPPTREELKKSLPDILYVMTQCFSWHLWRKKVHPSSVDLKSDLQAVCNTVIEGNLNFLRKLNNFFRDKDLKPEQDFDLFAYHFGFKDAGCFYCEDDAKEFHRRVAHITFKEVREKKVQWNFYPAIKPAMAKSFHFLDYLANDFFKDDAGLKKTILQEKEYLTGLLAEMEEIEKQYPSPTKIFTPYLPRG